MTTSAPTNSAAGAPPARRGPTRYSRRMRWMLAAFVLAMFGFGYAMIPMYRTICEALGINVLARGDAGAAYDEKALPANTQVDLARSVTIEFDANARGPWSFHPEQSAITVHPGQLATVMYEFTNTQSRTMTAQAIPSWAPGNGAPHFHKIECFCFEQHTLKPGESRRWPVTFYVDDRLPKDIGTLTLSYTFFEVGGTTPPAPAGRGA
jgi:cytochrome c oxidase assembly protein subunit 11